MPIYLSLLKRFFSLIFVFSLFFGCAQQGSTARQTTSQASIQSQASNSDASENTEEQQTTDASSTSDTEMKCDDNYTLNDLGKCVPKEACSSGNLPVNGTCDEEDHTCPTGSTKNDKTGLCEKAPTCSGSSCTTSSTAQTSASSTTATTTQGSSGASANQKAQCSGDKCTCDAGLFLNYGNCLETCPASKMADDATGKCVCPPTQKDTGDDHCEADCPQNTKDFGGGLCLPDCKAGFKPTLDLKSCESICPAGQTLDATATKCVTPSATSTTTTTNTSGTKTGTTTTTTGTNTSTTTTGTTTVNAECPMAKGPAIFSGLNLYKTERAGNGACIAKTSDEMCVEVISALDTAAATKSIKYDAVAKTCKKMCPDNKTCLPKLKPTKYTVTNNWGDGGEFNRLADIDGDGFIDIVSAKGAAVYIKQNNAGAGFTSLDKAVENKWGSSGFNWFMDITGDKKADLVSAKSAELYVKSPKTDGSFLSSTWPITNSWGKNDATFVGDFNGDGRNDIASSNGSSVFMKLNKNNTGMDNQTWTIEDKWGSYRIADDLDGDGKTDIISGSGTSLYLKMSTGTGFVSKIMTLANQLGSTDYTWVSDFTGDGLPDLASVKDSVLYVTTFKGKGKDIAIASSLKWNIASSWGGGDQTLIGDFNGDKRTDIFSGKDMNLYMRYSNTNKELSLTTLVMNKAEFAWGSGSLTWAVDVNQDGVTDVITASGANVYVLFGDFDVE